MELCTFHFQATSKLPSHHEHKLLTQSFNTNTHCSKPSLPTPRRISPLPVPTIGLRLCSRSPYSLSFLQRATTSEETSSGASQYGSEERDAVATLEDVPQVERKADNDVLTVEATEEESPVYGKTLEPEVTKEESPIYGRTLEPEVTNEESSVYGKSTEWAEGESSADEQNPMFEFLDKLNIDYEDTYSIALYGSGALFALWLASAVVGAIDAIPLFPKLMELIGLGYTVWFTYRYLIFKNTRDELFAKFEGLKQEVLG